MPFDKVKPKENIVEMYEDVENRSRDAVFKYGGSISNHHGVGKLRKRFMERSVSDLNSVLFEGVKKSVDPNNIFAINNMIISNINTEFMDNIYIKKRLFICKTVFTQERLP